MEQLAILAELRIKQLHFGSDSRDVSDERELIITIIIMKNDWQISFFSSLVTFYSVSLELPLRSSIVTYQDCCFQQTSSTITYKWIVRNAEQSVIKRIDACAYVTCEYDRNEEVKSDYINTTIE